MNPAADIRALEERAAEICSANRVMVVEEELLPRIASLRSSTSLGRAPALVARHCESMEYLARQIAADSNHWREYLDRLLAQARVVRIWMQVQNMGKFT